MTSNTFNEIDDDYDHTHDSLEYVMENIIGEFHANDTQYEKLWQEYNSILTTCCECSDGTFCDDECKCFHGGNYISSKTSSTSELVINEDKKSCQLLECFSGCNCESKRCRNRLVQRGPRKHLQIIETATCGSNGLRTTADIPKGAFICEYAGELLTRSEALRRISENEEHHKMNYIICYNEIQENNGSSIQTIIDPSKKGNIGRYLNHSCNPNCEIHCVRTDCPIPKLCIFSRRFIKAGEELCFHYGGGRKTQNSSDQAKPGLPCLCGSENCEKFLPNTEF